MNDFIVDSVLRGVLGGRRKRSRHALRFLTGGGGTFVNAGTLLTAAGVAWGIFDTMQQQQQSDSVAGGTAPATVPPVPATVTVGDDATRMVRLAISAANADGTMTEQERAGIVQQAGPDAADLVARELNQRRPLAEIVAGVGDPAQRATLYVLAYTVVRADEQVSGAERIYLAQLAHLLGLDPATVQKLETDTAQRIDAQGPESKGGPEGPPLRP
jgi:uncharacterized membrane protein YebE (DUF533 family)